MKWPSLYRGFKHPLAGFPMLHLKFCLVQVLHKANKFALLAELMCLLPLPLDQEPRSRDPGAELRKDDLQVDLHEVIKDFVANPSSHGM